MVKYTNEHFFALSQAFLRSTSQFYIYLDVASFINQYISSWITTEYQIIVAFVCSVALYFYPPYTVSRIEEGDKLFRLVSVWLTENFPLTSYNITTSLSDRNPYAKDEANPNSILQYHLGYGNHTIQYRFWLFLVSYASPNASNNASSNNKTRLGAQGKSEKASLVIKCYGIFPSMGTRRFLYETGVTNLKIKSGVVHIFEPQDPFDRRFKGESCWKEVETVPCRSLQHVLMDERQRDEISDEFKRFYLDTKEEAEWRAIVGLKHKRAYLFHGIPGTGKSSLILALASAHNLNICNIDLRRYDPDDLKVVLRGLPKFSMVVYEDIRPSTFQEYKSKKEGFPLSVFLNLLDGISSPEGYISVITTNYIEELNLFSKELVREGRINKKVNFTYITQAQAVKMFYTITSANKTQKSASECSELAEEFGRLIPEGKFKHSTIQEHLVTWRGDPTSALAHLDGFLLSKLDEEPEKQRNSILSEIRTEDSKESSKENNQEKDVTSCTELNENKKLDQHEG